MRISRWTVISIVLGAFLLPAQADYVALMELVDTTNSRLEWEPLRDLGRIVKGEDWVVFKLGVPFCLLGGREKIQTEAIVRRDGGIAFPRETANRIMSFLSRSERERPRIAVILIDPGHGGRDPGAIGKHQRKGQSFTIQEKDVVLDVSARLFALLTAKYPHKRVVMTRDTDVFLELEERTDLANSIELADNEAIIFVSLHANAAFTGEAEGFEVWYLPPEYKRDVLDRSKIEEQPEEILPILNTMLEAEYSTESVLLAGEILEGLQGSVGDMAVNRGLKEETWFVVRKSMMPSVLIELGFVTNQEEALMLKDDNYLQKLARGLYNGINRFVERYEKTKGFTE